MRRPVTWRGEGPSLPPLPELVGAPLPQIRPARADFQKAIVTKNLFERKTNPRSELGGFGGVASAPKRPPGNALHPLPFLKRALPFVVTGTRLFPKPTPGTPAGPPGARRKANSVRFLTLRQASAAHRYAELLGAQSAAWLRNGPRQRLRRHAHLTRFPPSKEARDPRKPGSRKRPTWSEGAG